MSNIFKSLRLIGRREEREEMNRDAEVHPQNHSGPNATENDLEQNPSNARGDFRHQRPRYRRSARKRLRFPSKHESEPAISCRKTAQEEIPHASHSDARGDDAESCDAIVLKDDITDNEAGGTKGSNCSAESIDSKATTKRGDDMNESFEVLMPDLLSSNGDDLSTKKVIQLCNEATPDPPVLHRMDTGPGLLSVHKDTGPGLFSVSQDTGPGLLSVSKDTGPRLLSVSKDTGPGLLSVSKDTGPALLSVSKDTGPGLLSVSKDTGPGLLSVSKDTGPGLLSVSKDTGPGLLSVSKDTGPGLLSVSKDAGPGLLSVSKDTGPGTLSVSKEDVDLSTKYPVTRAQARKEEFQLLKLLCSDEDTTQNDSLPLLSLSKEKRRRQAFTLGQEVGHAPLKVRDVQEESCSKKNIAMIERNDLNTPLGESNLNSSNISLLLSRSSSRRKQEYNKIKECNDQGVTVPESQRVGKDFNEDIARLDAEKQGSGSNKENNEYVKIKECNDEELTVPELESPRVGEDLNEDTARLDAEKQGSRPNKENNKPVEVDGVKEVETDDMLSKERNESREDIKDAQNQFSNPPESTEAGTKSDKQDIDCFQNDTVLGVGFEEMQWKKGNRKENTNYQEHMEPTESTEVENRPDGGDNESKDSKELQGGGIDGLQSKEENDSTEGTEEPSRQEKTEPIKSPKIDEGCEEVDSKSPESSAIPEESVDGIQCKEETNNREDTVELSGHESAEHTEVTEVASRSGVEQMQQEKGHHTREPSCQENTEPTESTKVETRSAEGPKESLETGQEGNANRVQFNGDDSAEETKLSSDQSSTKATESPKVENRSEEVNRGSQETNMDEIKMGSSDGMPHQSREPDVRKNTEPVKSTEVKNCLNGEATFESQAFVLTGPQDAPITTNLSPTITPRKMYEMFAAPNSYGNFNGSWPMADKTTSHVPRKRGRPRKVKTERQPKMKPVNNIDAYNMQMNNLEWCRMVSAPGTLYSHGDGMFMMAGAIPQGQPQEFSVAGGYYSSMMSSREQIPFRSTDDIDAARAASSDSGIDSQGAGELEKDPSGSKATKGGEDSSGNAPNYSNQVKPVFQPRFDGLYMIESAGGCIPVHPPYGTMIPPPASQAGTFGPYGYPVPINGQYFPNQTDGRSTNLGADGTGTSRSTAEQNDSDNIIILDSSHSIPKADAGGDESVFDETNKQTLQDMPDIHDALRILLGDAFDPSISDPGELLAMYGAELLKDEELRMEFMYFCEQLLNHEMMMMSQSGGFFPGAFGDFAYPYPTPFTQPAMWPPPGPCPPGWYPNDVAYYFDGESYIPIGPVHPDPRGNLCMILPDGHPDRYGQPQGAGDYVPVYAAPDVNAGNAVSMEQFIQAGGNRIKEQSSLAVC